MVTFNRIKLVICLLILVLFNSGSFAEEDFDDSISLSDLVNLRIENSKNSAQDSKSTSQIPEFSEAKKNDIAQQLNSSSADDLKIEGAKLRDDHSQRDPDGIMATMIEVTDIKKVTGDNCKGCEKYGELKMFTDADLYMQDPISQMDLIKSQGCPEENENQGFVKQENIESFTDVIEELRICEQPKTKFSCTRTLSLGCSKIGECSNGVIDQGSFSGGMAYKDSSGDALTVGIDTLGYYKGTCATFEETGSFKIDNLDLLSDFRLVHIKFDDYIEVKLNDYIVYVGPKGGEYVRVEGQKVYNGRHHSPCELDTNWNSEKNIPRVNIDLKPYLKEGENVIQVKIIVSGTGEAWLKIAAKITEDAEGGLFGNVTKRCCKNNAWEEKWEEVCE